METSTRVDVDGEVFEIVSWSDRPGHYNYNWISGKNPGYGFGGVRSGGVEATLDEHIINIREFLAGVDPETGFME
ncbi:hypothetical protein [Krasilnikovia cinnamomea]|uniref:hypothetical protein n=1 Tax=Krasilnikovia cinnamomea TaxID=349313 RepID=UPI00102C7F65|nr:hypothetical protein [Krasilnikovia cinnamomea]